MLNVRKKFRSICMGLAFLSVFALAPTMAKAYDLPILIGWVYREDNHSWYHYDCGDKDTGWLKDKGDWYYLYSNGVMATGWLQVNGKWYYFNNDGTMAVNTTIDGYQLNSYGVWIE